MRKRLRVTLLFTVALGTLVFASGCPEREKVIDDIGGAPGRTMEKMRDSVQRAQDDAAERERQQLGDE